MPYTPICESESFSLSCLSGHGLVVARVSPPPFQANPAASPQDKNTSQQARETLQASALAYQQVVALSDVLTYTVTTPNAVLPPKTLK